MTGRIDAWTHILPPAYLARLRATHSETGRLKRWLTLPSLFDLDVRLRLMDAFEGYAQVLTLSFPPIEALAQGAAAQDLARLANDGLAELAGRHPDRFVGWVGALALDDPAGAVREIERAVAMGARGFQIPTDVAGRPLDRPEFAAVFDALAATRRPVWLHPYRTPDTPDYPTEDRSRYEIWWCFGWPYDTSAAMARLVFSGLFDRHPHLRVLTHHMGAMIPYFAARIAQGWGQQMGARTPAADADLLPAPLARPPLDYFRGFHADTALSGDVSAMRCGLDFFGAGRVLFASDFPFDAEGGSMLVRETLCGLDALDLPPALRAAIDRENALAFLEPSGP